MLTDWLNAAMETAEYEQMEDGNWFGHVTAIQGVWASEPTREETEKELRSVLEDWLLLSFQSGDPIPVINGIELKSRAA